MAFTQGNQYTPLGGPSSPGSNQYYNGPPQMNWPGNTQMFGYPTAQARGTSTGPTAQNNPYQVPGSAPLQYPGDTADTGYTGASRQGRTTNPGSENLGSGIIATGLQYGGLSQDFANYIMQQIGAGMSPFDLSTMLPGGGQTQPGQLTANLNPLLSQLSNFFMGGGSATPGANTLSTIANQGISALPEWQSMIQAQQQNIGQNQANLKEQFGFMGDLAGSPASTAMSNYMQQTTADQNALLGQLQQQNILQGQIPVAQGLFGSANQFGSGLQALDQQAIQNMYNEFQRVSPQNNPMLPYIQGLATLYPPTQKTNTAWENINSTIGALSGSGFSSSGGANPSTSIQF